MHRQAGMDKRFLLLAGVMAMSAAYLTAGLLEDFLLHPFQRILAGALPAFFAGLTTYFGLKEARFDVKRGWLSALIWLACLGFAIAVVVLCSRYPDRFDPNPITLNVGNIVPVSAGLLLGGLAVYVLVVRLERSGYALPWIAVNFPGLALSLPFLIVYYSLAVTTGILPDDNFYDTDSQSWFTRLAAPAPQLIEMRPVHPLGFLIFRPAVWLLSLLMAGEKYHAVLFLNASAGALCVFLAWKAARTWSASGTYPLLVAALLGASTSHLVLSAAVETYIFSAAALIAFLLLSRTENPPVQALVPAGLVTFGITLTNFIQTCIHLVFARFGPLKIAKYIGAVVVAGLVLAFVQKQLYPTSQPFYDRSIMLAEDRYSYNPLLETLPRTVERAEVLARTISTFSVVAPRPLVFFEETGCEFPCFQTYKHRWNGALINSYSGLGSFLARTWFLGLLAAGVFFVLKAVRRSADLQLPAALLACILFNFVLHMLYGDDPLLYSGNWAYAVVFFAAFMARDLSEHTWFRAAMLGWIGLLMVNNWTFLKAVLDALAPYLG